jgi:hypothetical protein
MSDNAETEVVLPGLENIGAELLTVEERKARKHTGARLEEDEARLQLCVELLGRGVGKDTIAKVVKCSISTVVAIERRHFADVVGLKKGMAAEARAAAHQQVRRILEHPDSVPIGQAAVTAGILYDKADQLEGAPSLTPEAAKAIGHAALNAWIDSLPRVQPVTSDDATAQKVIDVAPSPTSSISTPAATMLEAAPDADSKSVGQ